MAGFEYCSVDTADVPDSEEYTRPPTELLQSIDTASLPPARLRLRIGAPVMLLRNLFPQEGLCNGTRMVVTRLGKASIQCRILGGDFHDQIRIIPRTKLSAADSGLPYTVSRVQLPVRLCFAMTINKSQGQSFQDVGVDLRESVFTHGQFYVAVSRATDVKNCMILTHPESNERVLNVVFPEVLRRR